MIIVLIIAAIIYYFIGFGVVYFLSTKSELEGPVWILMWGFGPFLWPCLLVMYIYKELNKDLDRYEDFNRD